MKGDIDHRAVHYTQRTFIEALLKSPGMYVGGTLPVLREDVFTASCDAEAVIYKTSMRVPEGFLRVFQEIINNSCDNVERSRQAGVDEGCIHVTVDSSGAISVYNEGLSIPSGYYSSGDPIPQTLFTCERTSGNYDNDNTNLSSINGVGAKAVVVLSDWFHIELVDSDLYREGIIIPDGTTIMRDGKPYQHKAAHRHYVQTIKDSGRDIEPPHIEQRREKSWTRITYMPSYEERFGMYTNVDLISGKPIDNALFGISNDAMALIYKACIDASFAQGVTVTFNGYPLEYTDPAFYASCLLRGINAPNAHTISWRQEGDKKTHIYADVILVDAVNAGFLAPLVNGMSCRDMGPASRSIYNFLRLAIKSILNSGDKKSKAVTVGRVTGKSAGKTAAKPASAEKSVRDVAVDRIIAHFGVIIRARVIKAQFTGQSKDVMSSPEFKIAPPNGFDVAQAISKWNATQYIIAMLTHRDLMKLNPKKREKYIESDFLKEAKYAATAKSTLCSLVITEGLSASSMPEKIFHESDIYGFFCLMGKPRKLDGVSDKSLEDDDKKMTILIRVLGIRNDIQYTEENRHTLRYAKSLMIMPDSDADSKHIEALVIRNIFIVNASILGLKDYIRLPVTPVYRISLSPGNTVYAYTEHGKALLVEQYPKLATTNGLVKALKGLGSSSVEDVMYISKNVHVSNVIVYRECVDMLNLCFDNKRSDERKQLIVSDIPPVTEEIVLAPERSLGDILVQDLAGNYFRATLPRAIPSLVDGFKDVRRKIMYVAFRAFGKDNNLQRVASFAGEVDSKTGYTHGDMSMKSAITYTAQSFVGTNNIPLLNDAGDFGSQNSGRAGHADCRYIYTSLGEMARYVIRVEDEIILTSTDSGEPEHYYPIIPLQLVNGCEGIACGWSTNILQYNPLDIVALIRAWLQDTYDRRVSRLNACVSMCRSGAYGVMDEPMPWYRGYNGTIERYQKKSGEIKYIMTGTYYVEKDTTIITGIPPYSTGKMIRDKISKLYSEGKCKQPASRADQCRGTKDDVNIQIRFEIKGMPNPSPKELGLIAEHGISNMILLNQNGIPTKYHSVKEIISEFAIIRYQAYAARKQARLIEMQNNVDLLQMQVSYIMDVATGVLDIRNREKDSLYAELADRGYTKDMLKLPQVAITKNGAAKKRDKLQALKDEMNAYSDLTVEHIWSKELDEFEAAYVPWMNKMNVRGKTGAKASKGKK